MGGSAAGGVGACEGVAGSPARGEAPAALRVSGVAGMASVESDDTDAGHTFPDSGLPDCWRVAVQVYIICIIRK